MTVGARRVNDAISSYSSFPLLKYFQSCANSGFSVKSKHAEEMDVDRRNVGTRE